MKGGRYDAIPAADGFGMNTIDLGLAHFNFNSYLELSAEVNTSNQAGFMFDRYGDNRFKFAGIDAANQQLVIGHYTQKWGWVEDAVIDTTIDSNKDYTLALKLKGTTANVTLSEVDDQNFQAILGYVFNASTVDGKFGLMTKDGNASFDQFILKTDDRAFEDSGEGLLVTNEIASGDPVADLTDVEIHTLLDAAMKRWSAYLGYDPFNGLNITVEIDDLDVYLVAADGTQIQLFSDVCGSYGFTDALLDDDATTDVSAAGSGATTYQPSGDLFSSEGMMLTGIWTLVVVDDRKCRTSVLKSWSLIVEHA